MAFDVEYLCDRGGLLNCSSVRYVSRLSGLAWVWSLKYSDWIFVILVIPDIRLQMGTFFSDGNLAQITRFVFGDCEVIAFICPETHNVPG